LKGFRKVYGEADTAPDVRAVLAQIASCREEQSTLRKELRLQKKADFLEQLRLNAKGRLAGVQEQIKYAEVLEKSLTSEVETLATQRKNYAADARAAEKYRLEIEAIETNLASLLTRIERLKMELDAPPQVRELGEEARIEPVDETARRVKFAGFGGLGGLGAGLLLVGLLELRRRRVDCPEAVGRELGLRVMGTIPRPPAGSARRAGVGTNEEWQALLAGSVDYARTMLLHTPFGTPVQLIAITSAVSGEGKTSFASHLALSLARSGRRTLLVDGDFHNPSADRLFGIADAPGLSDLLRGEGTLAEAAHPGPVEHLFVTPAGTFDAVAARALAQDALAPIFDQMRADFDVIVVDCSPVLPVADALQVARHADGVILTLLQGHSRLPDAEAARERLAALNCRVLGAVVNGTGDHMYRYGSGYRYRRQPLGSAS
ncbi:MAG TPA: polysaccharide biosynthesis tyrosine autokinase, partial [Gemmataceae bacterium]